MFDKLNLETLSREVSETGKRMSELAQNAADMVSDIWDDYDISESAKQIFQDAKDNAVDIWDKGTVEIKRDTLETAERIKGALTQVDAKIGCFPGSKQPGVIFPSETTNSEKYYEVHKDEILLELYKELQKLPEGTMISTSGLLAIVRPDLLQKFNQSTLFEIHSDIISNAEEYGLLLDMSSHEGLIEGLPFVLEYEVKHLDSGVTITEADILHAIVKNTFTDRITNFSFTDMISDLDDLKNLTVSETVCVSSYLAACKYSITDAISTVTNNIAQLDIDDQVKQGLEELYEAPEVLEKIAEENGSTLEEAKENLNDFVDMSLQAGKATAYLSARLAAGSLRVVENPLKTIYSTIEYAVGDKEKAADIIQTSKVDELVDAVNQQFDESDTIESIGDTVDKFGEVGSEIALTILVFKGIPVSTSAVAASTASEIAITPEMGAAALSALSLDSAEKDLEENVSKTDEVSSREIISAYTAAAATAISNLTMAGVTNKLISMTPKAASSLYKVTELAEGPEGKVTGTLMSAAIASCDAGIMKSAEEIKKITHVALGLDESVDVKQEVKEFVETVGLAAVLSGVGYYGLNTLQNSAVFKTISERLTGKELIPEMDYFEQSSEKVAEYFDELQSTADGYSKEIVNNSETLANELVSKMDYLEQSYAEAAEYYKELQNTADAYVTEVLNCSEVPETLEDFTINAKELRKPSAEEIAGLKSDFDNMRDSLRKAWEEEYGIDWPVYTHDIKASNGTIIRKAGQPYDMHHKKPLCMGGTNDVSNITPLSADVHFDWQGVHSSQGPYQTLRKLLECAI